MNVIWLDKHLATRRQAEVAADNEAAIAISCALRYLKEEAEDLGEGYLGYLMGLAAIESRGLKDEGRLENSCGEDPAARLQGIANCLESLEGEAGAAGEPLMSSLIRWAREAADKRVESL